MITGEPRSATVAVVREYRTDRHFGASIWRRSWPAIPGHAGTCARRGGSTSRPRARHDASGIGVVHHSAYHRGLSTREHLARVLFSAPSRLGTTCTCPVPVSTPSTVARHRTGRSRQHRRHSVDIVAGRQEAAIASSSISWMAKTRLGRVCVCGMPTILLLGQGRQRPARRRGAGPAARRQCVVTGPADTRGRPPARQPAASNTASWLAGRAVKRHYHIAPIGTRTLRASRAVSRIRNRGTCSAGAALWSRHIGVGARGWSRLACRWIDRRHQHGSGYRLRLRHGP